MKYSFRKLAALSLALLLVFSALPVRAFAEGTLPKEEVVYINLNADGSVKEVNVVNIFHLETAGTITDYGAYEALRNMTSTAPVNYVGDTVTIAAEAGKLYYEGKLSGNVIPWNIGIRYYLDGKEYSAAEVAGKSGALKIALDINRNSASNSKFFDSFALQVSLTLDTAKCSHITAKDATIANVGSNKQVTYTILPGSSAQLEVTATVADFSMEGISINAIPLNLNMNLDDNELMGQVTELLDALALLDSGASSLHSGIGNLQSGAQSGLADGVDDLYDGAGKLQEGASALQSGGNALQSGASELQKGTAALNDGVQALNDGIIKMQRALDTLNSESATLKNGSADYLAALTQLQEMLNNFAVTSEDLSAMSEASAKVLQGLTDLVSGTQKLQQSVSFAALKAVMAENGLDVDSLQSNNTAAQAQLRQSIDENKDMVGKLKLLGYDVSALFGRLEDVILLLGANNAFIDGTAQYLNTVNGSMNTLIQSVSQLQMGYSQFDKEINRMTSGMENIAVSMTFLTGAVNTLVSEYQKLNNGIGAYTGGVAEIVSAYSEIVNGSAKLAASSSELVEGASSLYSGTSDLLAGIVEVYEGAGTLRDGTGALDSGVAELLTGIAALYDGASQLESGTSLMLGQGVDSSIAGKIDALLGSISGGETVLTSFVSEKNTQVESVQFVIKSAAVEPDEQQQDQTEEEKPLTFWQKLLKLFGLYKG